MGFYRAILFISLIYIDEYKSIEMQIYSVVDMSDEQTKTIAIGESVHKDLSMAKIQKDYSTFEELIVSEIDGVGD